VGVAPPAAGIMATKLETFLKDNKIDPRRLVATSRQIERLRPDDRRIKLEQRRARKSEDGKKPEGLGKPRSGRAVSHTTLRQAVAGTRASGPTKTRILRAVNRVLEQRKKPAVTLAALFDPPPPQKKKAPAADE
jgi:hypothetical protein